MDGAQQDFTNLGRLDVEHLLHQVADQGAVLGDQLLDELARIGMGAQGNRGQAQACRPALCPLGQAPRQVCRQRAAVLGEQQVGFGDAEREVS